MTDDDTKKSWAEHYPRWRMDLDAEQVCRAICTLIEMRARALSIVGKERGRLRRALTTAGYSRGAISRAQKRAAAVVRIADSIAAAHSQK
jgi:hypothetical protein